MSNTFIHRVCSIENVWDTEELGETDREVAEVYVDMERGHVLFSRYKEPGILVFPFEEWQILNNFIREEIEKYAEMDS